MCSNRLLYAALVLSMGGIAPAFCCGAIFGCAGSAPPTARAPARDRAATPNAMTASPTAEPHAPPPATEQKPVTDAYHGVSVRDDYRWLETSDDPAVRAWTATQNAYSRRWLDAVPGRDAIGARIEAVLAAPAVSYGMLKPAGGQWFTTVRQPPKQQAYLIVLPAGGEPGEGEVLVDPNALDPSGKTTIDWFVPSPDGRTLAVSLSKAGTENGDVTFYDVASGTAKETLPRVNGGTAGGDLVFSTDGRGVYYTRYPAKGERPDADLAFYQQLYFHRFGDDPSQDRYELGRELPKIAEIRIEIEGRTTRTSGGRVLALVQDGDGGRFAHYLRAARGGWRQLTGFDDGVVHVAFGPGGDLFAVSRKDAPRGRVLRVNGKKLDFAAAKVLHAPEQDAIAIDFWNKSGMVLGAQRWYATFQLGGPSELRAFDYKGQQLPLPAPFEVGAARGPVLDDDGALLFNAGSFLQPSAWFRYDPRSAAPEPTTLRSAAPIELGSHRVVRELATSRDGTQVPLNVLVPNGAQLDGQSACVVNGYGGYGVSMGPGYSPTAGLWLERGVIFVVANLRGGGEFGEEWHRAGNLERKQNVFDDFAAVLSHLHARGYCKPERTGIVGGSNGGLLMGATLVQHPELVRAVVSFVGFYDSLRSELSPNGVFNIPEFGTVADRKQFEALYAYSPYHHVRDGAAYPPVLFITGDNDPRVDPMHSRKMTARLQAASPKTGPFLLRTTAAAGHGSGTDLSEFIAQQTDAFAFLLAALE